MRVVTRNKFDAEKEGGCARVGAVKAVRAEQLVKINLQGSTEFRSWLRAGVRKWAGGP
jgi:hypothetical protein